MSVNQTISELTIPEISVTHSSVHYGVSWLHCKSPLLRMCPGCCVQHRPDILQTLQNTFNFFFTYRIKTICHLGVTFHISDPLPCVFSLISGYSSLQTMLLASWTLLILLSLPNIHILVNLYLSFKIVPILPLDEFLFYQAPGGFISPFASVGRVAPPFQPASI